MCGKRLREARKAAGLTQVELADLIARSQPSIYKWEKGVTEPPVEVRHKLAEVLGVDAYAPTEPEADVA